MSELVAIGRQSVLLAAAEGPAVASERDANDLIGDAMGAGATLIAVPVARLDAAFFQLRSGLAGAIAQKIVNYRLKLAIVGDIAGRLEASSPLRDWVREANRGTDIWFVADMDELTGRLAGG